MIQRRSLLTGLAATSVGAPAFAAARAHQGAPVRLAVAGLSHGHVGWLLEREAIGDVEVVAIHEPDADLAHAYAGRLNLSDALFHLSLEAMLDAARPEAVAGFGPISDHHPLVQAAAPRGVHVMVEKPLTFDAGDAARIADLAARHRIQVLTNYETSWYPSAVALKARLDAGDVGSIRRAVFRDGHWGPKEIGVGPEFLDWLTDPERNGGGALIDFGCYGANLMTWLMDGAAPLTVTALTSRSKTDPAYARVDDEATVVLTYPTAQAVIQASWNWPDHIKDMEVFGETGRLFAPNSGSLTLRRRGEPEAPLAAPPLDAAYRDGFAFLAAALRGRAVADTDRSSLTNGVVVAHILDAARRSARDGVTVGLSQV